MHAPPASSKKRILISTINRKYCSSNCIVTLHSYCSTGLCYLWICTIRWSTKSGCAHNVTHPFQILDQPLTMQVHNASQMVIRYRVTQLMSHYCIVIRYSVIKFISHYCMVISYGVTKFISHYCMTMYIASKDFNCQEEDFNCQGENITLGEDFMR